jgi:hypothetical protein
VLRRLDVGQNLDIHPEYALDYAHVGLAPVAGIARTPSFVLCSPNKAPATMSWVPVSRKREA